MEPSEALKKLESIVESNKDPDQKGQSKSWIASIIIFFVVLIGIFVFAYVSNKNAKELAKLRHEKNKREIEETNLKVEKEAESNDMALSQIDLEIADKTREIHDLNAKIITAEKAHTDNVKAIDSITNWRDI